MCKTRQGLWLNGILIVPALISRCRLSTVLVELYQAPTVWDLGVPIVSNTIPNVTVGTYGTIILAVSVV